MIRKVSFLALLLPGACAGLSSQPPPQPTPASIQAVNVQLSVITSDPVTTWQIGDYAVRSACHAYINGMAARAAELNLGGGALGMAGGAAAIASANPMVGAATALGVAFLNLLQSSGAIPYTTETSMMIEAALNAYEAGVASMPPTSIPQAVSYVDDLWYQCSAGGYAILVSKSIAAGAANVRSLVAPLRARPFLMIEEGPSQMDVVTAPPTPTPTPQTKPRLRVRTKSRDDTQASTPLFDPDKPSRIRWLRETMTCIRALDGAC